MTRLRKGDTVTLTALVTDVAPYDDGQQIMVKLQPNGKALGWLLQKEVAFEVKDLVIGVGDQVTIEGRPYDHRYEVMAQFNDKQTAVKKTGCWPVEIVNTDKLRRV